MQGIIDRFENNFVVIEADGKMYNVNLDIVNEKLKEGDVVDLVIENSEIVSIKKNELKTTSRKKYIEELTKNMWK